MMTDEQVKAKKQYAGEKKASMKRRDDHHDYKERRMYMITLEVEGRHTVFGRLVGNPYAKRGSLDEPRIELSELGKAVQEEWLGISRYYPQIKVLVVQMMPDHMHGILFVMERLPVHLGKVISGFKTGCRKARKALEAATAEKAGLAIVVESSLATAKPSPAKNGTQPYLPLFAKGYNDLILHSYDEFARWKNYLLDNPRRLLMKRARPEWLRPFFDLNIGSQKYNGIGNRDLLSAPLKMAVRVSRRLNDSEIAAETARYLELSRQGAVLVSPAVSPGEKSVMRAAFNACFPTIVLMANGFTPLSKPQGEQFDACAQGRLLMLSPWEHHNEKKMITAEQCKQMNLMALEICGNKNG